MSAKVLVVHLRHEYSRNACFSAPGTSESHRSQRQKRWTASARTPPCHASHQASAITLRHTVRVERCDAFSPPERGRTESHFSTVTPKLHLHLCTARSA